ncbi:hypothetical protein COUCH_26575 [Couchioplanes caeruleus]|uniref:hypothetical protein n=1 Tax=Couchioplanes caeruleus TaxID=56438 RepID=UPI0020BFD76A|nr:hypothetical protein [Couchioplanes caeruleus]UQU62581.1 hypothetical protein COUCH_26575 [Couchioplanes caeruleus]
MKPVEQAHAFAGHAGRRAAAAGVQQPSAGGEGGRHVADVLAGRGQELTVIRRVVSS